MEPVQGRITIHIYEKEGPYEWHEDANTFFNPPKEAEEILQVLRIFHPNGVLKDDNDTVSPSDMLGDKVVHKLYKPAAGEQHMQSCALCASHFASAHTSLAASEL